MEFSGTVVTVKNMEVSRRFYEEVLGQKVKFDFGANIAYEGGAGLIEEGTWCDFIKIKSEQVIYPNNSFELYFEEENYDAFLDRMKQHPEVRYVHETEEFPWGQRVSRIYDPDGHIIEVGEHMKNVIRRFLKQGLSVEETVKQSQHPIEFVEASIEEAYNSEHCIVYYRPEIKAVYLKWKKFSCGEQYRKPCEYLLELLHKYQCENFVVNAVNGFEDTKEDVEWAFEYFIPSLARTSCKTMAFIMGADNSLDHEIDMFTKEFMKHFKVERCHSIEEAAQICR